MSKRNNSGANTSIVVTAKAGTKTEKILEAYSRLGSVKAVAEELGIKYQHVYNTLRMKQIQPNTTRSNNGVSLSDEIVKLHGLGKTTGEIAKILSAREDRQGKPVSYQQVYNTLKNRDLLPNRAEAASVEIEIDPSSFMSIDDEAEEIAPDLA
jgi:DNA-binding CsgD family transcriptional regulator